MKGYKMSKPEVEQKSVNKILSDGAENKFIIPEYQRPYAWTREQVETLFEDLLNFAEKSEPNYFLGSIVSFKNTNNEQEIIDGQQRITSLFLLLRAIYTKLSESEQKTEAEVNFIRRIESALWKRNSLTGKVDDYGDILIESKVINNSGNEVLRKILKTGTTEPKAKDNYSLNYLKFQELFNKACVDNPLKIYDFILRILDNVILLQITADTQDTALTIFNTLNNRGLPLSDADIFKATIYKQLGEKQKNDFIVKWQELEDEAEDADESIQSLFYYYMFYLRGVEGDFSSTTPGVRNYFIKDHKKELFADNLLDNLNAILNLWRIVNNRETIQDENWSMDIRLRKALDILSSYPNEFWKYPVVTYYLTHKEKNDFTENFLLFLNRLTSELLSRYLLVPSINAVKSDIMKLNTEITKTEKPEFNFKEKVDKDLLPNRIKTPTNKAIRMLLKLLTYLHQDELLPAKWEIEHIFPQKWHSNYFDTSISEDMIKEKIEFLGNKVPLEKKLNIQAGNGYFLKKQEEYRKSEVVITKELSDSKYKDWGLENITERGVQVCQEIQTALEQWINSYSSESKSEPTPEEKEEIKRFKEKGWI